MSAGGLIGSGIALVVISFVSATLGYVVDIINSQTLIFALSQGTLNTMNYLTLMFWIFPFTFLFMLILNYIVTSASEAGGYV